MEERVATSPTYRDDDDKESYNGEEMGINLRKDQSMQIVTSGGASPNPPHATYVVQMPKDQIYRVPPPENAAYVQRYCQPVQKKASTGRKRRCLYWLLSIFFVVGFLASVIFCVNKFTLSPIPPTFSIKQIVVKQPPSSTKNASLGFQVSVETTNPNTVNDIEYLEGTTLLAYKGKQIGKGNFPAIENEKTRTTDDVDIVLAGLSKANFPDELQKSDSKSHNNHKTRTLKMNLAMSIPIRLKTWLRSQTTDFHINCEFEADSIGDHMKIQSQNCEVHR